MNGITAQRIIKPLCDSEYRGDFFLGNYSKVTPINRTDESSLQSRRLCRKARELYWAYAHSAS